MIRVQLKLEVSRWLLGINVVASEAISNRILTACVPIVGVAVIQLAS